MERIKNIGVRLLKFRKQKSLTQQLVADALGTSSGHISEIEAGKKLPGSETLLSLLRAYGLNINWLLNGKGTMFVEEKRSNTLHVDDIRQAVNEMIDSYWDRSSDEKRAWFKVELERHFPELLDSDEDHPAQKKRRK